MPRITTEVSHQLGQSQAIERLRVFVPRMAESFADQVRDMQGQWIENALHYSFVAVGFTVRGQLIVEESVARVHCDVPVAAMLIRGRLEKEIRGRLTRLLAESPSVD